MVYRDVNHLQHVYTAIRMVDRIIACVRIPDGRTVITGNIMIR
jgi:hypothetical protein